MAALKDVTLALPRGGTLGIVGESGSRENRRSRAASYGFSQRIAGAIEVDGAGYHPDDPSWWRNQARRVQMVFQDPYASLQPATQGWRARCPGAIDVTALRPPR